jgi:hypothetical protein
MNNQEILKWIREVDPRSFSYNVVGIGWGPKISNGEETGEYSVIFLVNEKKSIEELSLSEIVPSNITIQNINVKTDVQAGKVHTPLLSDCHTVDDVTEPVKSNRIKNRPLKAGSESETRWGQFVATLGTFVIDKNDGQIVALSNNHVYANNQVIARYDTANSFGSKNTLSLSAFQPTGAWRTSVSEDKIGTAKIPVVIGNKNSDIVSFYIAETTCDAATVKLDNYNLLNSESLRPINFNANPPYEFATDDEIDSLLNISSPNYGAPVFRSGRTCGPVGYPGNTNSCNLSVYQFLPALVGSYNGFVSNFTNSFYVRGNVIPGRGGDSGSAMYALFNYNNPSLSAWKLIGLLFAGPGDSSYTIGSRITAIAKALNIAPWDGTTIPTLTSTATYINSTDLNSATIALSSRVFYQLGRVSINI